MFNRARKQPALRSKHAANFINHGLGLTFEYFITLLLLEYTNIMTTQGTDQQNIVGNKLQNIQQT